MLVSPNIYNYIPIYIQIQIVVFGKAVSYVGKLTGRLIWSRKSFYIKALNLDCCMPRCYVM